MERGMGGDRSRRFLVAALCGGYFLVLLDVTVVNVALPRISSGLHAGSAGLAWVVDAYAVPLAALLQASGSIGDRLGHRRVVLAGFAGFGAASVGCALAPTIGVLVAARAVQGVGAALMLPGTLALLVETAPDEGGEGGGGGVRDRLVGVWAAVGGAALPAGPLVGGLLVQAAGWRAVFWLGVPVIVLATLPVARLPRGPGGSRGRGGAGTATYEGADAGRGTGAGTRTGAGADVTKGADAGAGTGTDAGSDVGTGTDAGVDAGKRPRPGGRPSVDWVGAGLLVAALGCAVTAIILGADSPVAAGVFGVLALCAGLLLRRVERASDHPLLDVPPRSRGRLAAACAVAGLMNLCVLGSLFLLTRYFQDVRGLDPLRAGLATLPAMLPLPLLGAPAGRLAARVGVWRTSALGLAVGAAGFAGVAAGVAGPYQVWLLCALAVWGAGLGVLTPAIVSAALQAVPGAPGTASGASNTSRQTGGALGVAVFGAVAGEAAGSGFVPHTTALLAGAAGAFALTAVLCHTAAGRLSRE